MLAAGDSRWSAPDAASRFTICIGNEMTPQQLYKYGYPTDPFTRLTPEQMEKLLKDIDRKQRQDALKNAQEALL